MKNPNNRERLQLTFKLSLGIDNFICQFEDALCAFLRRDKIICCIHTYYFHGMTAYKFCQLISEYTLGAVSRYLRLNTLGVEITRSDKNRGTYIKCTHAHSLS